MTGMCVCVCVRGREDGGKGWNSAGEGDGMGGRREREKRKGREVREHRCVDGRGRERKPRYTPKKQTKLRDNFLRHTRGVVGREILSFFPALAFHGVM